MKKSFLILMFSALILIQCPTGLSAGNAAYQYDSAGRLIRVDFDNGRYITYQYDANGNLLERFVGPAIPGDVYPDFNVTLKDAVLALQVAAQNNSRDVFIRADVDQDQKIGVTEALYVMEKIAAIR